MTDLEALQAQMTAADAAYVEKTGKQPYLGIGCSLTLGQRGNWKASIWMKSNGDRADLDGHGDTPEAAIAALMDAIAALPSQDEANLREFQRDLGHLIDKGRKFGIDVAYVNPLAETAKRLAENVLTDQRETAR